MGKVNIFLIRHGESVDNVAGLYAGSRDSPLTSHGVIQARRLAAHLSKTCRVSHIFTSNLQRAVRTAEEIRDAQSSGSDASPLEVVQLLELREKDFGSDEGKKFGQRERAPDEESHESMRIRATRFAENELVPIVASAEDTKDTCNIMVVAHGLILNALLRVLRSAAFCLPSHLAPLDSNPSWSNTGYVQVVLSPEKGVAIQPHPDMMHVDPVNNARWPNLHMSIPKSNYVEHLVGLKKTRGGIGSAQFDDKQKTLTSFFTASAGGASFSKKRKAEDQLEK